jgi:hypothetical protein
MDLVALMDVGNVSIPMSQPSMDGNASSIGSCCAGGEAVVETESCLVGQVIVWYLQVSGPIGANLVGGGNHGIERRGRGGNAEYELEGPPFDRFQGRERKQLGILRQFVQQKALTRHGSAPHG